MLQYRSILRGPWIRTLCLLFLMGSGFPLLAQKAGGKEKKGKVINGYYDHKVFYHPKTGPYLETYIAIDGKTLHYKKGKDDKPRSKVRITVMIKEGDSVVGADKTINHGPTPEGRKKVPDLVDVKRFKLDSGVYSVKIELEDLNADTVKTFTIRSSVTIPRFDRDSAMFSHIELLKSYRKSKERNRYTKSGYRLIPNVSNVYPQQVNEISFYAELYNTHRVVPDTGRFAIRYYIYDRDRQKVMKDYGHIKAEDPAKLLPYLNSMKIGDLPAGNYYLVFEARNSENELMTRRSLFFQRKQPKEERKKDMLSQKVKGSFAAKMDDIDSLRMYTRALMPKADPVESQLISDHVEVMNLKTLQRFFYGFWVSRNKKNPAKAWFEYKKLVDLVNKKYGGTYKKGFQTDRGRVMLQYGKPDRIAKRENKPHSYPYEIWQYYEIGRYTNKRFVFYDSDLAGNDYQLLHSDMPGELRNRRWRRVLQDRQNVMDNVDDETPNKHYGREVDRLFRNP